MIDISVRNKRGKKIIQEIKGHEFVDTKNSLRAQHNESIKAYSKEYYHEISEIKLYEKVSC